MVARRMEMVDVTMKSGIARVLGKRIPRPPLQVGRCVMRFECGGRVSIESKFVMKSVMRVFIPGVSVPWFHVGQSVGEYVKGRLCIISAPRRCGSLLIVHVLKILSLVCKSGIPSDNLFSWVRTEESCSSKNEFANEGEPTGVPRRRNPSVSSTPIVDWVVLHLLCE